VQPEAYAGGYDETAFGVVKYDSPYTNWILAGRFPEDEEQKSEWRAVSDAIDWLGKTNHGGGENPFLLRVSFNAPHTPVAPPEAWLDRIDPGLIDISPATDWDSREWPSWYRDCLLEYAGSRRLSPEALATIQHHYYAEVAFLDSQVGRLLDAVEAAGLRESTIVAFCSDHGTHLGDFGLVQKQTFFEPVVRVPFVISVPGHSGSGGSVATPVSIGQLLPTLMSLCGIPSSGDFEPIGDTILRGEEEEAADHTVVSEYTLGSVAKWGLSCPDRLRMVRQGSYKLCYSLDDESQGLLFDLEHDPRERNNLFHGSEGRRILAELKAIGEGITRGRGDL
jgi:arylsulfatase A-like enzyme